MKKLLKLFSLVQAVRHGGGYAARSYKPWKGKKWKGGRKHQAYGYQPHAAPPPPYGYGPAHDPYGQAHHRPRGIKGMLLEAIVHRLLRR